MKDFYKNPLFYYVLAPVVIAIWPLLLASAYLPASDENWEKEKRQYEKGQKIIKEILAIDPDRLDFANSKAGAEEFDYAIVVNKIAESCNISSSNYNLSSKPIRKSNKQKSQNATVILKDIDITRFAKFLSTIQLRWGKLQCERVKLTKKKGLPDTWKIDLDFKYYF